jgi:hypothetical protein
VTDTAIGVDGKPYHEGTVLARQDEQPRDLDLAELLERASSPHHVEVAPIVNGRVNEGPDWGSRSHRLLRRPRVGVLGCQGVDEPSFGAVRHLLDVEAGIPVAVAHPLRLARWSERLDVLIVPDLEPDAAASDVCGPTATSWLYDWVSAGGVLIAIGRGAGLPADIGLAGTTLDVAGAGWLPTGAFLEVELAPQGALTVGVTGPLPAMCQAKGRLIKGPGASVAARYSNADRLRIAGLLWPEGRDILAGTPYLVSERVGHGAVVLFSSDPIWRGASRATSRLLLRALVTQPRDL